MALNKLYISVTVYGPKFIKLFLRVTAPNLCSLVQEIPDDLRKASVVRIFCKPEEVVSIDQAPIIGCLRQLIAVEVEGAVSFKEFDRYGDYAPMCVAQSRAVAEASGEGAALIFVGPDLVFSRGSFKLFVDKASEGYRVVVGPSLRANMESALPLLQRRIKKDPHGFLTMSAQDISELIFSHWHEMNERFFWNCGASNYWRSYVYWRVNPDELLIRFLQGPTFFAWPKQEVSGYEGWIDHALVASCCDNYDQVYVIPDSSEAIACDLTAAGRDEGLKQVDEQELHLFKQCLDLKYMNRYNINYAYRTCTVHRQPEISGAAIRDARRFGHRIDPILGLALKARIWLRLWAVIREKVLDGKRLRRGLANGFLVLFAKFAWPIMSRRS